MSGPKVFDVLMTDPSAQKKLRVDRPIAISILCLILFLLSGAQFLGGVGMMMANKGLTPDKIQVEVIGEAGDLEDSTTLGEAEELPPEQMASYMLFVSIFLLVSAIGLWMMRKWGVYLFAIVMGANLVMLFIVQPSWMGLEGRMPWSSLVLPLVYAGIVAIYWGKIGKPPIEDTPPSEES